ncbi:hypothetical protein [Amycolatopsis thermophila]|uniref:Helix-turn-helix domain-containing protein n=1 Tax=Amycolatopsis thermophila TaxID=206084 RepID=A0ABU0EMT7_9PSEU|nr:hypothetical protein [Amycolatopsis thermophila]MDQ0376588.1 hypothetical protein [Amycolatopsis thermophila]
MKNWTVEVLVRVQGKQLDNDDLIALADLADEQHEWTLARWELGNGFWIIGDADAVTTAEAADKLYQAVAAWIDPLPLNASVASVRAVDPDVFEMETEQSTVPELVSSVEAAEILGVTRQRVNQLADRPDFPAPLYRLKTGPLWTRMSVEAFGKRWVRKPGRPRKAEPDGGDELRQALGTVTSMVGRATRSAVTGKFTSKTTPKNGVVRATKAAARLGGAVAGRSTAARQMPGAKKRGNA